MLHPDQAREQVRQFRLKKGTQRCVAALGKLPRELARAGLAFFERDARGEPIKDHEDQAAALADAARFLDGCPARDRLRIFSALFPGLAPGLEGAWQLLHTVPYGYGPFRAPRNPVLTLAPRVSWLHSLLHLLKDYREDVLEVRWLAAWAAYLDYWGVQQVAYLLAAAVDAGGPEGEEVFQTLRASALGEHEVAGMGQHVARGLLTASRADGWELLERMLLAAQRQEGLRETILGAVPGGHPQAFRRFLRLILHHRLLRFSSVLRTAGYWVGRGRVDVSDHRDIHRKLSQLHDLLNDEGPRRQALSRGDGESLYLALWAGAFDDADAALGDAADVMGDRKAERRFAAVTLLTQLQHPGAMPLLCRAVDDPDLRVALTAFGGLRFYRPTGVEGIGWPAPDETWFAMVERLLARMPAKAEELAPLVWQEQKVIADRRSVAGSLLSCLGGRPPAVLVPFLPQMGYWSRYQLVQLLAGQKKWDAPTRAALLTLFADRDHRVREAALQELKKRRITPEEARRLEDLLTSRSRGLRRDVAELLFAQADTAALESCDRLLAGTRRRRLAGLGLLRRLAEAKRRVAECRARAGAYRARHPDLTDEEREDLDAVLDPDRKVPTLDDALGLMDPARLTPVVAPKKRKVLFITPAAVACLEALDDLAHEHRETVIKVETRAGVEERLLGSGNYPLTLPGGPGPVEEQVKSLPLYEVWEEWWRDRPARLRDRDGRELLRASLWKEIDDYEWRDWQDECERYPGLKPLLETISGGQEGVQLRYGHLVGVVIRWLLWLHPPEDPISYRLDALETASAMAPLETLLQEYDETASSGDGPLWHDFKVFRFWLEGAYGCFETVEQQVRLWQILHWRDRPAPGAPRMAPGLDVLLNAFAAGAANEHDVFEELLGPRRWGSDSERGFGSLRSLTTRQRPNYLEGRPQLQALVDRCRERVLEVELARGEAPTAATKPALAIQSLVGLDTLLRLLTRLGSRPFRPGGPYGRVDESRERVLTHLVSVTVPGPQDTPEAFAGRVAEAVAAGRFSSQRVVELAFVAPLWAAHVEHCLGWPGFAEGVWWFFAHMLGVNDYVMDQRLDTGEKDEEETRPGRRRPSVWERLLRQRTPLTREERAEGAIDVDWFRRAYEPLGPTRWQALADAAPAGESRRSALGAWHVSRVLLGKASKRELVARVRKKKSKQAVRLLGLLPLAEGPAREKDLLDRYRVLQEYRRHANSLRKSKPDALRAADIGLENLARTAGYPDPVRLEWAMEARVSADLAAGPLTQTADGVTVSLAVGAGGQPELTVRRGDEPLESVPRQVRGHKGVAALLQRRTELRRQASRIRQSLEGAMCRGDAFTGAELQQLLEHPLLAPSLASLVLVGEGLMGYPVRGGKALRGPAGDVRGVKRDDRLRIAHPHDLLRSGEWHSWQHDCFTAGRVQPFKQVFRELYVVTAQESKDGLVSHRYAGQQVNPNQAQALFNARAWDTRDGIQKTLRDAGIVAEVWFQYGGGTALAVEGWTLEGVEFRRRDSWEPLLLKDVPPRVFSEVMRDLDLVVSVAHLGGVDPEASASTVEMRAALLRETCALLRLTNVRLKANHALVDGRLGNYTVHLGSGVVHRLPGGHLCIVPVYAEHRGRLFLPFADDDPRTAEVLSKVILLARDDEIRDPAVLDQIRARP